MSTTATGNAFRDRILGLLRSKFPDAYPEGKAAWKNADIVFTMMELGKRIKVAVECKNYNRSLNTTDFSQIVGDYQASIDRGEIHLLLVIANRPIEAASRHFIDTAKNLRFLTVAELESWLVGLEPYVRTLAEEFTTDEVHQYYVEGRFEGKEGTAFDHVQAWVSSDIRDDTGMAVLGGYGLGKSSLAKRVASAQARRYLDDPDNERLPILLPLGQVVHETELAALFGKQFTSRYALETYSYKTLLQLNEAGRLLIILDGFDEMKHAMTEHDFRSNFREFNKLRVPGAKVLLLGRPNSFTSESSNLLIRGLEEVGGQSYTNSDFPAWKECRLAFFTPAEQRLFLDGFLRYKSSALSDHATRSSRISEVINDIDDEILQRPVQARIVGLLAADTKYTFRGISRFRLYADFVRQVIYREQEKRARSLIPAEHRHRFLRNLAWWSWTRPGVSQGTFLREEVPDVLFEGLSDGHAIDSKAKRAEYLVSSLTEEKDSNFLYFAHRSFHEFLVAAYITSLKVITPDVVMALSLALSEELIDFLAESGEQDYLELVYEGLSKIKVPAVSDKLLDLLGTSTALTSLILEKPLATLTALDILIIQRAQFSGGRLCEQQLRWMGRILSEGSPEAADAAGFVLIDQILKSKSGETTATIEFLARSWERMLSGKASDDEAELAVDEVLYCSIGDVIAKWTRKLRLLRANRVLLNVKQAHAILQQSLFSIGFFGLPPAAGPNISELDWELIETNMNARSAERMRAFYRQPADEFPLVRRKKRRVARV